MIYFFLGLFTTSTILLLIFIFKFYDFSLLKKEKVSEGNEKKKDYSSDIDKSAFFK